jgi:hypothetical protein
VRQGDELLPVLVFLIAFLGHVISGNAQAWDPLAENPASPQEIPSAPQSPEPSFPPASDAATEPPNLSPAPSSYWTHNGSTVYLVAHGDSRQFYYEQLRPGMLLACAQPDSLLFDGVKSGNTYSGTAVLFSCECGSILYQVAGPIERDGTRVVMSGRAPMRDRSCQITGYRDDRLVFDYLRRY